MGSSNSATAKDGIDKLIKNKSLIIKYLNKSVLYKNYMNNRCTKAIIPGEEIEQNSTFYIYNIEGFFDIEKGLYFYLIKLLESIKLLEDNNISINSYEDLEVYVNSLLSAMQIANCICNSHSKKEEKNSEQKCQCTEIIEEKKEENFSIDLGFFSYNKNEQKSIKKEMGLGETEKMKKEINKINFTEIPNYISLIIVLMGLLQKGGNVIRNKPIKKAINWLSGIIPFNELKEIICYSLRAISGTLSGISNIYKGIKDFQTNKVLSLVNMTTGFLELSKVGLDSLITYKKVENQKVIKNKTKAQENFHNLIIRLDQLFEDLIKSNLEKLKKNNIIILGIDQSKDSYNEGIDLQLYNIDNIDTLAKCLNENEEDRAKYIENMIYFYNKIAPKLDEFTAKGEKVEIESLDFLLSLQEFITKNCNNKYFWINMNNQKIEVFIDYMEKEYQNGKNYFKENSNDFKNKLIQSLGVDEKESEIKKSKTLTIKQTLYDKECEPPAPSIDIKTSRKYIRQHSKY